jgi:hypothetical protein
MHTYVRYVDVETGKDVWTVGYFVVLKTNGTQSFVPMFDVASTVDARVAVTTLNGSGPVQTINIVKEYTEGVTPLDKIPTWKEESS